MEQSLKDHINDIIEKSRSKVLDLSRRNPLINNTIKQNGAYIRIIDEKPQQLYETLFNDKKLILESLPEIEEDNLPDEQTQDFKLAYSNLQKTDDEYIKKISSIDFNNDESALQKEIQINRDLKDQVRKELELPPRPKKSSPTDIKEHAKIHGIDPSFILPQPDKSSEDERYQDDLIQTLLLPEQLNKRANNLLSKERMFREERGLDIIYLVLGFLSWRDPNSNDKKNDYKSPVFIIPVNLEKVKSKKGFKYIINKSSDAIINPALTLKLENEFGIYLNKIKYEDDDLIDVEELFESISAINPKLPRWEINREAVLGAYAFQGINLYNDLRPGIDFSEFPLLKELYLGKEHDGSSYLDFEDKLEHPDVESKAPYLVMDADSSQLTAITRIANGENVALEGPPGSGKSQTIVNIIANSLNSGKKILFVAQKMTALEVVYNRLKALNLHNLVLPMVAGKENTNYFYEVLKERLDWRMEKIQFSSVHREIEGFREERERLAKYIKLMNSTIVDTAVTIHQAIGLKLKYRNFYNHERFNHLTLDKEFFNQSLNLSRIYEIAEQGEKILCSHINTKNQINIDVANYDMLDVESVFTSIQKTESLVNEYEKHKINEEFNWFFDENADIDIIRSVNVILNKSQLCEFISKCNSQANDWIQSFHENCNTFIADAENIEVNGKATEIQFDWLIHKQDVLITIDRILQFVGLNDINYLKLSNQIKNLQKKQDEYAALCDVIRNEIEKNCLLSLADIKNLFNLIGELEVNTVSKYVINNSFSSIKLDFEDIIEAVTDYRDNFGVTGVIPSSEDIQNLYQEFTDIGFFAKFTNRYKELLLRLSEYTNISYKILKNENKRKLLETISKLKNISLKVSDNQFYQFIKSTNLSLNDLRLIRQKILNIHIQLEKFNCSNIVLKSIYNDNTIKLLSSLEDIEQSDEINFKDWDDVFGELEKNSIVCNEFKSHESSIIEVFDRIERYSLKGHDLSLLIDKSKHLEHGISSIYDFLHQIDSKPDQINIHTINEYRSSLNLLINLKENYHVHSQEFLEKNMKSLYETILSGYEEYQLLSESLSLGENIKKYQELFNALDYLINDKSVITCIVDLKSLIDNATSLGIREIIINVDIELKKENFLAIISENLTKKINADDRLNLIKYTGMTMKTARENLTEIDARIKNYAPKIISSVSVDRSNPPKGTSFGKKSDFSELSLIKHQISLKRKIPPRKLLKRAQESLKELFPCWMMTPDNVAQFLQREPTFDLVIIDEASQMTPENSIPALMRANQALISGDTNQLPPTDFFKIAASIDNQDEDDDVPEESILEQANIRFYPKHQLRWHYRSRHEDLIKFSNHHIYDDKLTIFPSPRGQSHHLGISLVRVDGIYQGGKSDSRINPAEATVMVQHILEFCKDNMHRSLGVVVMNANQREEIESMLLKAQEQNKDYSNYIDHWNSKNEGLEKLFVKNIENVQGDERDVIFIGTVYGKNSDGRFLKNFGPLNGLTGKRRLNVLLTRAKEQIVTFTSIPINELQPQDHQHGPRLLKSWLQFSCDGVLENRISETSSRLPDSPFEEHVIEAIESLGYQAVPQVGVSNFFIDIGVKHSDYPYGYVCGVECDGATYHSSKTARDRDILRQSILENLGWTLYRIWSTDWFNDPLTQTKQLKKYLDDLLNKKVSTIPEVQTITTHEKQTISEEKTSVKLGDKLTVRYLDGVRAGAEVNFWLLSNENINTSSQPEYKNISLSSPLGSALVDSFEGEIVTYEHNNSDISVQILRIL